MACMAGRTAGAPGFFHAARQPQGTTRTETAAERRKERDMTTRIRPQQPTMPSRGRRRPLAATGDRHGARRADRPGSTPRIGAHPIVAYRVRTR